LALGFISAFDVFDAGLVWGGDIGETADVGRVQFQMLTVFVDLSSHLLDCDVQLLGCGVQRFGGLKQEFQTLIDCQCVYALMIACPVTGPIRGRFDGKARRSDDACARRRVQAP